MTVFRPDKYMPNPAGGFWLPLCASTRTRPGALEPEVWFRIVHLAQAGHSVAPVVAYREQTVEISLGPKGAFEKGNTGTPPQGIPH